MSTLSYEAKQTGSPSRIVRWSHGSRFLQAEALAKELGARRLIDYGSGDGTFIRRVAPVVEEVVGTDYDEAQLAQASARSAGESNVRFVQTTALGPEHERHYDAVFCMEVLEHCLPDQTEKVLSDLERLVTPEGAVVISVPIEIGPTLLGKLAMRGILGLARVGDYGHDEKYSARDLARMVFAGSETSIERTVYRAGHSFHAHKGFNWRALERRLRDTFVVESRRFSPLPWSRGLVSSQAWFVCRLPGSATRKR